MPAKTEIFVNIAALQRMTENSKYFMKCQTGTGHLLKSFPNCLSRYNRCLGITCNAQVRAGTFRIFQTIARRRRREGTLSYCCKTDWHCVICRGSFYTRLEHIKALQLCIRDFSLLYGLCYDGPFRMKSCPKTVFSMLSFYEKDAVAGISPFYFFVHGSGMSQRLVHRLGPFGICTF